MTIAPDSATEADGNGAAPDAQLESLRAVPNEVWQHLVSKLCLSLREAQTAQLLCEGMTKPKIAESLGISRHTVPYRCARPSSIPTGGAAAHKTNFCMTNLLAGSRTQRAAEKAHLLVQESRVGQRLDIRRPHRVGKPVDG